MDGDIKQGNTIPSDSEVQMETAPVVSVVVPNYNYARYLPQRIGSILSQTFTDFEVILLDDASTDGSVEVMRRYAASDPRISRIEVNETNSGSPFRQWEKGIGLARGRYIWIAEADDFADSRFLACCVGALECNADVAVAFSMSEMCDSGFKGIPNHLETGMIPDGKVRVYDGLSYLLCRMQTFNAIYNASMAVFRKSAFEACDMRVYRRMRWIGDWAFWSEMLLHGKVAQVGSRLNVFRQHPLSTTKKSLRSESLQLEETIYWQTFGSLFKDIRCGLLLGKGRPLRRNFWRKHVLMPVAKWIRCATGRDCRFVIDDPLVLSESRVEYIELKTNKK